MNIYIDGKIAALKSGDAFEYISENRLFSGADDFSLSITLPLKDSPENLNIFGNINRADVSEKKVLFDCVIVDVNFVKAGSAAIVEINDVEVKIQFLEGRSEQNYNPKFDETYIDELAIENWNYGSPLYHSVEESMQGWDGYVAMPWVNANSGEIHNACSRESVWDEDANEWLTSFAWDDDLRQVEGFLYLHALIGRICAALDYSVDLQPLLSDDRYKYLVVCNVLPGSWRMRQRDTLPHWTVEEFFSKLEKFLSCEINIDHRSQSVSFRFSESEIENAGSAALDNVVDEFNRDVDIDEINSDFMGAKNIKYKSADHPLQKFYDCDWFIKRETNRRNVISWDSFKAFVAGVEMYKHWDGPENLYECDEQNINSVHKVNQEYYLLFPVSSEKIQDSALYRYHFVIRHLNAFRPHIVNDNEKASSVELEFVPACIDYTNRGFMLSMNFKQADSTSAAESDEDLLTAYTKPLFELKEGETDNTTEYYDKIFIGWWNPQIYSNWYGRGHDVHGIPHPLVENFNMDVEWNDYSNYQFSLKLYGDLNLVRYGRYKIDPKVKTTFKFLSDRIPNVRSLFIIKGKRYLCEKLTINFSADTGKSNLIKGEFYRVAEG